MTTFLLRIVDREIGVEAGEDPREEKARTAFRNDISTIHHGYSYN